MVSGVLIAAIGITAGAYMGNLLGLAVEIISGALAIWILWPRLERQEP